MAAADLRIGLIGLDTSHVVAFTNLLNDTGHEFHVPGGRVAVAYPGGSADFELSHSRVAGYTEQLRDKFGVRIVDSPEAVAEDCDALLLTSVDGRVHRDQFERVASYGRPTFVDKPFAVTTTDAQAIVDSAARAGVPLMSCSSHRFSDALTAVLADSSDGEVVGIDCWGPMAIEPTQPGLFWYGIHTVEMAFAVLGPDCRSVRATTTDDHDVVVGTWADGRLATIRGNRTGNRSFGAAVHRERGSRVTDDSAHPRPGYASLLERVMELFRTGKPPFDPQDTVRLVRFIETANRSRESGETLPLG